MNPKMTTGLLLLVALAAGFVIAQFISHGKAFALVGPDPGDSSCSTAMLSGTASYHVIFPGNVGTADVSFDWGPGYHHNVAESTNGNHYWLDAVSDPCVSSDSVPVFNLHLAQAGGLQPDMSKKDTWQWTPTGGSPPTYSVKVTSNGTNVGIPLNSTGVATQNGPP